MKITEEIRAMAAEKGVDARQVIEEGLEEKAREFREKGAEIYTAP